MYAVIETDENGIPISCTVSESYQVAFKAASTLIKANRQSSFLDFETQLETDGWFGCFNWVVAIVLCT